VRSVLRSDVSNAASQLAFTPGQQDSISIAKNANLFPIIIRAASCMALVTLLLLAGCTSLKVKMGPTESPRPTL